jgi:alanine racemase
MKGLFTHLASAEDLVASQTDEQGERFAEALGQLRSLQVEPKWIHVSNSAALLGARKFPENLVRIGALVYGYCMPLIVAPGQELPKVPEFEPVLTFKSRIVYMKDVPSGTPLGYSAAFYTRRPSRIATVPVGYADGLSHALSNRGCAIVRGRRARIVGSISMDLSLLDVTDIGGTNIGDEVILMGQAEQISITALEIAQLLDTVPYEILCSIGKRVPRLYVE